MMISLHMPKCGGTSFMELLRSHFKWRFAKDYDYPIHQSFEERTKQARQARNRIRLQHRYLFRYRFKKCIHGHFLPYKYNHFYETEGHVFVTWLRDPVERLVSHYNFWRRSYENTRSPKLLHQKMMQENWTFREFAFSKELQNFYSIFLWNFPITRFHFIGITEHYEKDVTYFAQHYLGLNDIAVPQKNRSPGHSKSSINDESLIEELKSFHARDYKLYNYALNARKKRNMDGEDE